MHENGNKFSEDKVNDVDSKAICQECGVNGKTEAIAESVTRIQKVHEIPRSRS